MTVWVWGCACPVLFALLVAFYLKTVPLWAQEPRFALVVDAGSTGSRCHLFRIGKVGKDLIVLPFDVTSASASVSSSHIPLAECIDLHACLVAPLVSLVNGKIPTALLPKTPIFVFATAGVRLLPQDRQAILIKDVRDVLQRDTAFEVRDVRVLSGVEEAVFLWTSIRALVGEEHVGVLDLGGGSAQIAFPVDGAHGPLLAKSFLRFGINEARYRHYDALERQGGDSSDVVDPCLPPDVEPVGVDWARSVKAKRDGSLQSMWNVESEDRWFVGSDGGFESCFAAVSVLLNDMDPLPVPPDNMTFIARDHFVRLSTFLELPETTTIDAWEERTREVCRMSSKDFSTTDHKFYCFEACFALAMLRDAYHLKTVTLTDAIHNVATSWAAGAVIKNF